MITMISVFTKHMQLYVELKLSDYMGIKSDTYLTY